MNTLPAPGSPAPDFVLRDARDQPFRLGDQRGRSVVLAFYPGDWSPSCARELALFQETLDDLVAREATLAAISTDSPASHRAWADARRLTFPLLSDFWPHGAVSRAYGVFRERDGTSHRSLFVVDPAGVVRELWLADDPEIGPGVALVFDALDRIRRPALIAAAPPAEAGHA
jgi:peroxiredoxin